MMISIIIRTYNEEKYLEELLSSIRNQATENISVETIIVDSGSNDKTLEIAKRYNCNIQHIKQEDFTFGYSLNVGCEAASGDYLVFVSGHCVPAATNWLIQLCKPLITKQVDYVYGRQLSHEKTQFSEKQIFDTNFPNKSSIPQRSNFCNNANAAMNKSLWRTLKFNESISGLEDLDFAQRAQALGYKLGYQSKSSVFHIHEESWSQIQHRFRREAQALKQIAFSSLSLTEAIYWFFLACISDCEKAFNARSLLRNLASILKYRYHQFRGLYLGRCESTYKNIEPKRLYFWPYSINKER
ncbi:MAG: glycosyltransferase [Paraglaciecola sp.]|uniref:glycosyltransferase family 2 protein n=1 Tax=Paraglaciecola sp. TaxID=1920173 RepID=UPI00329A01AD